MSIARHLDKKNLHHAYLILGRKEEIIPEVVNFLNHLKINPKDNPDFYQIIQDTFKIEDARNLKKESIERGITQNKKIFIICVNSFLIDAQNTLLKMFEEPIENTIFFLIVPNVSIILPTLLSRFYVISAKSSFAGGEQNKQAEEFLKMTLNERLSFIKEVLIPVGDDDEEDSEVLPQESNRSRAIKFLNALEITLQQKLILKSKEDILSTQTSYFDQIFVARTYLQQPGSSTKSLLEGIALVIPKL